MIVINSNNNFVTVLFMRWTKSDVSVRNSNNNSNINTKAEGD